MNSPVNMITRRNYHANKAENYRRHFPHAGSDGCNLQRGRQRQCHERRMGHHAGAGLRCSEPYNEDGSVNVTAAENVMVDGKIDMSKVNTIALS